MAFEIISGGLGTLLTIERSLSPRWLQPSPDVENTAKVVAVFSRDDSSTTRRVLYAGQGFPVLLEPNKIYEVTPCLLSVFREQAIPGPGSEYLQRFSVVISDEYRPLTNFQEHLTFSQFNAGRFPSVGTTETVLVVPNPGARRVGVVFSTDIADVFVSVRGLSPAFKTGLFAAFSEGVIGPTAQSIHASGTADVAPLEWAIDFTNNNGGGNIPTIATVMLSFHRD